MISKWHWLLNQVIGKLWFRISLFAILGIASALAAILFKGFIPDSVTAKIGADAVDRILNILASSMLAVTTFSLSVMVQALSTATSNATPRATRLLAQDSTTQNVLATFIGSFLFSLVGIIALTTGAYGGSGRLILFVVTIFVIGLIVVTIVRWIDYLTDFGRVGETTSRVERAVARSLQSRKENPFLGGMPIADPGHDIPLGAFPVYPQRTGYVQHVDIGRIADIAEEADARVYLCAVPGTFVHPHSPLLRIEPAADEETEARLRGAWTIGEERSFDQDPRFGLVVLAEIAARALSPGINDPGTAIDVIGRVVRLLIEYNRAGAGEEASGQLRYPRVHVPALTFEDLFDDAFAPIARHGADNAAVQTRLQKAFAALAATGNPQIVASAREHSRMALSRAAAAPLLEGEQSELQELSAAVERAASP